MIRAIRARATTLEAMALLALGRALVAWVPLASWRRSLGDPITPPAHEPGTRHDANRAGRRLVCAVERAAERLPGESRCLPRAMALQWMLRRRRIDAALLIGILPGPDRDGVDDLHAWVVRDGEILIGASDKPHHPIYAVATRFAPPARKW